MSENVQLYATGMPFPEGPEFAPDGTLYVCVRRHGWIAKIDTQRTVHRFAETGGKPQALALAPDKSKLYLADAVLKQILTVGFDGRLDVLINDPQLIGPNDLTFGPVSGDLFFTDPGNEWDVYNGNVFRYSLKEKRLTRLAKDMGFPNGLAVSKDEKYLLVGESLSDRLWRIDLSNPESRDVACQFAKGSIPDGMEWLTTGKLAVAQHGPGHLSIVDPRDWSQSEVKLGAGSHPTNVAERGGRIYVTDDTPQGVVSVATPA